MSQVRIERSGNRILLASEGPTPGLARSVPGAYWRDGSKVWSLPLDLTTCALLRERFGKRLEIGPQLWGWAKAERAKREEAGTLAAAADADLKVLPEVAPVLAQAMSSRTYQRVAVRFVADSMGRDYRRRALIADTVGLGKTAESLAACLESEIPGPYLIICPKTAVDVTWTPEIRRWLPDDEIVTIPDGKAARNEILTDLENRARQGRSLARTWVVLHPASIRTQSWWICRECGSKTKYRAGVVNELDCGDEKDRKTKIEHEHVFPQLFGIDWGAVIVDESDQVLIRLTGTPNLQRRGAELLRDLVVEGGSRIAMSGTPFRSKPPQMWSTLNWLDPIRFSSKWGFIQRYWETENGFYGGMSIGDIRPDREHLLTDDLLDIMIRRDRRQVRDDLPDKNYAGSHLIPGDETSPKGIWLPMKGAQLKAYDAMAKYAAADIKGGTLSPVGILAEMTRLKQLAGAEGEIRGGEFWPLARGNKFEWLIELCKELGFPDEPATKLAIASQSTKLLKVFGAGLQAEFKGKGSRMTVGYITGEESRHVRTVNVAEFEEGPLNVIFLNTKAGGSSITLDAAEIMVVLDETWIDDDQEQVEGRIDNRNPERKIVPRTYYYPRSLGSIEEGIAMANVEAKRAGRKLLDGGARKLAEKVMR